MAEAGQSKQALENLKLWAGIFSCSSSSHTHCGELALLRKAARYTPWVRPPTEEGWFIPNHKTTIVSNTISIVPPEPGHFVEDKRGAISPPPQKSLCYWDSLILFFCGVHSILVFIFSCLSFFSFLSFQESHFLFPGVCWNTNFPTICYLTKIPFGSS